MLRSKKYTSNIISFDKLYKIITHIQILQLKHNYKTKNYQNNINFKVIKHIFK